VEEKLCAEGLDVRTKREGLVKSNTEELGSGVECKRGASQSELGFMRSLTGSVLMKQHSHLAGLTGRRHFRDHSQKMIEGLLDRVGSFQRVRGGRPDGEIISIE